jgi:hypothetical protein
MIVYMATDQTNGMSYIGATSMQLKRRKGMHLRTAKKSHYAFHQALRERPDRFDWKIIIELEGSDKEMLNLVEQEAIDKYKTHVDHGGYNMTLGGIGSHGLHYTEEHRKRNSDARRGAKRTNEMRRRMAEASTSRKMPIDAYDTIMTMRANGLSFSEIGRLYSCSESAVRGLLRRRNK